MRTLHVGLRVSNLDPSLAFYRAVGYTVTGTVEGTPFGNLTMLQLQGDPFVTIELVHNPAKGKVELGTGINHLVIQVESLDAALADLAVKGIAADSPADPDHADRLRTGCGPAGSPTPTVIESNWSSGRPATPTASPRPTSPSRRTPLACQPLIDAALLLEHDG
jgi:lactoylglutathione lyase